MKHTKEPWKVSDKRGVCREFYLADETGDEAISVVFYAANARRIVACINACKGITTEALEAGIIDWALARAIPSDGIRESTKWEDVKVWEAEG